MSALARRGRRRKGHHLGAGLQRQPRQRRDHATVPRRVRLRLRAASPHSSLWLRERGRLGQRRPQQHRREFLLRRLRQQLRRRQVGQALSQVRFAAGLRHRRGERARTSCAGWRNGTCRRTFSSRSARRASICSGCGRRCSPRGCGPIRATRRAQPVWRALGAQVDLYFSVLHRYDMTLSAGYAVGLEGSQRKGSEWMISLKIM